MSKRFTDTEKWRKPWFRKLSPSEKVAWFYITENCDNVGVWDADYELAEFQIGAKIDWDVFINKTNGNIEKLENGKLWLIDFVQFQHGDFEINSNNKAHLSYVALLKKHNLLNKVIERFNNNIEVLKEDPYKTPNRGLIDPSKGSNSTPKEKERERVKEREKEQVKEKEKDKEIESKVTKVLKYYNKKTNRQLKIENEAHRKNIRARLSERYGLADCVLVIDYKYSQWWSNKDTKNWVNVVTLFRPSHFDTYLNEAKENEVELYNQERKIYYDKQFKLPKSERGSPFPAFEDWQKEKLKILEAQDG